MADFLSKITLPDQSSYPIRASAIPYGEVDDTSTSDSFTASVPGIYALEDGVTVLLKNEVMNSSSSVTININSLGAKPIYNSNDIDETGTIFSIDSTMLLTYNSTLVSGGCWICYKGYDIPPTMTILSYGSSTWDDFIAAYNSNTIVYCRASSNSNPASGNQTRMAFMAYVNSNPPTEVEFQYYKSVSSHSATQQGDQVYIYKLNKNSGWSVTVREAMSKIAAGTGLSSSYSSGTITLSANAASTASLGAVKPDGSSIAVDGNGTISATGVFSGKVTAGSTASNSMDLVTLSQLEAAIPTSLPYYSTTLNTAASTFAISHYLGTANIQVSVIGYEASSTYMVPMSPFSTDLAYMVKIIDEDTVELDFSRELDGNYAVNILGMDHTIQTDGNYLLI